MSTYNINKYKKILISASAFVFIFGFFFYTEGVASASANNSELWVEATVEAKGSINVYATPDSRSYSKGSQTDGSRGVIIEGPSNNLQTGAPGMFKVDFESGFDGWTHDTGLFLIPPTCDSFTVYPATLPANGGTVTLNWNTTNATFVGISPTVGEVLADDSVNVNVTSDTTYTLEAANSSGSDYCQVTVDVQPINPPVFSCSNNVNFSANPSSIDEGNNTTLTWNTTGVTSLSIDNGISLTSLNGSASVAPSSDVTYTLTASNGTNTIYCPVSVDVNSNSGGGGSSTLRCDLSVSDKSISAGDMVTIKWNTSYATDIILQDNFSKTLITTEGKSTNDKNKLYDDEITVQPNQTTSYILTATHGSKEKVCKVTVSVKDSVVVLQTRDQLPLVSGITLTQVPYTGFDAGPFLTFMFYALLVLWALYLAYILVIRRNGIGGMSLVTAGDTSVDNISGQTSPDTFVGTTLNKPVFHQPFVATAIASTAPIGYANMITNSDEATEIENHAHAAHVLLSSDAMRYFVTTTQGMDRMEVLDSVLERAKASYPSEDGWVVLNEDRIKTQCDACEADASVTSNEAPFIPAILPIGNSSLAEVIVSGNIVAAYQMIGHRPMIALADAAADLDALYRIKQGGDAQVSDMLANAGENVIVEQLHDAIAALTSALDGTYTNEAEAVKMAIMKATKAING